MKRRTMAMVSGSVVLVVLAVGGLVAAGVNSAEPLSFLHSWEGEVSAIERVYDPEQRAGEIVFYGASNFAQWSNMETDLGEYRVQNHGFGGSSDADLVTYADRLLCPYDPAIVVLQTGSNDYIGMDGTDRKKIATVLANKERMLAEMHVHLPDAHLMVLSGLILPGRPEYTELTLGLNDALAALDSNLEYLTFVDAEALTYDGTNYDVSQFVEDGIHLTSEARREWAEEYIAPAIEKVASQAGFDSVRR